jgi:hypothetical protein
MIGLLIVFYLFIILFGVIGSIRGWAKEVLVIFSVILGMAVIVVISELTPVLSDFVKANPKLKFWLDIGSVALIAFFGYQSPRIARLSKALEKRDKIQDILLGLFLGAVSGYMVIGTLWHILHHANYFPITKYVVVPPPDPKLAESTDRMINMLPPAWLGKSPNIFIALVLGALFVVIVFV